VIGHVFFSLFDMENNDSTTSLANLFSAVISLNPHMAFHIIYNTEKNQ
jgi:hypothetical protein